MGDKTESLGPGSGLGSALTSVTGSLTGLKKRPDGGDNGDVFSVKPLWGEIGANRLELGSGRLSLLFLFPLSYPNLNPNLNPNRVVLLWFVYGFSLAIRAIESTPKS
jgi:hypothetical protein